MYEQSKSGWGKLAFLLFWIGFTGSISVWQGGFAAWFLCIGSLLLLLPGLVVLFFPFQLTGERQLVLECGNAGTGNKQAIMWPDTLAARGNGSVEEFNRASLDSPTKLIQQAGVHSGESLEVHWNLRLDSMLPVPWLMLSETWGDASGAVAFHARKVYFPWFRKTLTWSYKLPQWGRGVYTSQGGEVTSGDFPGLVLRKGRVSSTHRVLVWPRIHAVSRGEMGESAATAVRNVAAVLDEPELSADRRPYRPGDSLRRIDWRASARASSWLVREREWTRPARVWMMVDTQRVAYESKLGQERFEAAIELAAALLHTWDSRVVEVVLAIKEDGDPLYSAGGSARLHAMTQLAEAVAHGRRPFHQRLVGLLEWIRPEDRVIAITPRLDESVLRSARMVKQAAEQLQLWIPHDETMTTLKSGLGNWKGYAEGMDIVRCVNGRALADALRGNAADEAGGIARA